jgi:hypothetical protein
MLNYSYRYAQLLLPQVIPNSLFMLNYFYFLHIHKIAITLLSNLASVG